MSDETPAARLTRRGIEEMQERERVPGGPVSDEEIDAAARAWADESYVALGAGVIAALAFRAGARWAVRVPVPGESEARTEIEVSYDERDAKLAQSMVERHIDTLMEHLVNAGVRDVSITATLASRPSVREAQEGK
jgi:hypothetical protein